MKVSLYNTMTRSIEEFKPLEEGVVKLYTCGPTVYNYAHIGNLRTYVFEDLLRRTLEYAGYRVEHVMNVTDVGHLTDDADEGEDKMVKSSRETGMSVWDIAEFYTKAFFEDIRQLHIVFPTITCKATEHIDDMINLIKRLEQNGHTYESGGNIYFSIDTFPDYGKLARLDAEGLQAGSRIEVDEKKRNPRDFVLWFTQSKFEHQAMLWDSPWGKGYPGWHLECSAMSMRYLGDQFDIHCGGVDHVTVHHTNEIAQSEGATGKSPWVRYWLHGEFLVMGNTKMAKSKGNFITLRTLIEEGYDPLDYRYFCLGGHYRSQLQFKPEALDAARAARLNLMERIGELREKAEAVEMEKIGPKARSYVDNFASHVALDLHIPKALSVLWGLLKDDAVTAGEKLAVLFDMDGVLGIGLKEQTPSREIDQETLDLIREREEARIKRDFSRADKIRDLLLERGIVLKDTPEGTKWSRKM